MNKRHLKSLELVDEFMCYKTIGRNIFDLGKINALSKKMSELYIVTNNSPDIDFHKSQHEIKILSARSGVTTAFEILEHLLNPFEVLKSIESKYLICTVPLNVWFSKSYWSDDKKDRHFHEFEERQFLWLLAEAGWNVKGKGCWKIQHTIGFRPFLRLFYPSYLWIVAKKKN